MKNAHRRVGLDSFNGLRNRAAVVFAYLAPLVSTFGCNETGINGQDFKPSTPAVGRFLAEEGKECQLQGAKITEQTEFCTVNCDLDDTPSNLHGSRVYPVAVVDCSKDGFYHKFAFGSGTRVEGIGNGTQRLFIVKPRDKSTLSLVFTTGYDVTGNSWSLASWQDGIRRDVQPAEADNHIAAFLSGIATTKAGNRISQESK